MFEFQRNTFQAVLITDSESTFVIYYYNKIEWTGTIPAQVQDFIWDSITHCRDNNESSVQSEIEIVYSTLSNHTGPLMKKNMEWTLVIRW